MAVRAAQRRPGGRTLRRPPPEGRLRKSGAERQRECRARKRSVSIKLSEGTHELLGRGGDRERGQFVPWSKPLTHYGWHPFSSVQGLSDQLCRCRLNPPAWRGV